MSRVCELTGKGRQVGNNVSHANNKTKRTFLPNLQNVTLISDALGQSVKLRVSTHGLRSVEHVGGLDNWLAKTSDDKLSPQGPQAEARDRQEGPRPPPPKAGPARPARVGARGRKLLSVISHSRVPPACARRRSPRHCRAAQAKPSQRAHDNRRRPCPFAQPAAACRSRRARPSRRPAEAGRRAVRTASDNRAEARVQAVEPAGSPRSRLPATRRPLPGNRSRPVAVGDQRLDARCSSRQRSRPRSTAAQTPAEVGVVEPQLVPLLECDPPAAAAGSRASASLSRLRLKPALPGPSARSWTKRRASAAGPGKRHDSPESVSASNCPASIASAETPPKRASPISTARRRRGAAARNRPASKSRGREADRRERVRPVRAVGDGQSPRRAKARIDGSAKRQVVEKLGFPEQSAARAVQPRSTANQA